MDSLECQLLAAGFRSRDDYKFNTTADRAELVQDLIRAGTGTQLLELQIFVQPASIIYRPSGASENRLAT